MACGWLGQITKRRISKKNRRSFFTFLLSLLLTLSVVSCSGHNPESRENEPAEGVAVPSLEEIAAETEAEMSDIDLLPEADYEGYTFNILSTNPDCLWGYMVSLYAEEETGEPLNDFVFRRNTSVEDRYDIKIANSAELDSTPTSNLAKTTVQAGDDVYSIMCYGVKWQLVDAQSGCFINLHKVDSIDFAHPWWNGEKQGAITLNGGTGIISSNTFADNTRHIVIGKQAKGAVITGNYSENFLSVQNGIGKLAKIADNIPEPYEFTRENYSNYKLLFNGEKDKQYISGFIYAEPTRGGSRWSSKGATIELPGNPGETYTVSFRVDVVEAALTEGAGIYVGDKNLMPFTGEGSFVFKNKVKMPKEGKITFTVKCKNWVPHELDETNLDTRVLGVAFMEANMVSDPKARTFSMNTLSY
jgi:hypothetical protein